MVNSTSSSYNYTSNSYSFYSGEVMTVSDYWSNNTDILNAQYELYSNMTKTAQKYKAIRPTMPSTVTPTFTIMKTLQLSNTGVLSISGLLVLCWYDLRLTWNSSAFYTSRINLQVNDLWYPPLSLLNTATTSGSVTPGFGSTVQLGSDGFVTLYIPTMLTSTCTLDLNRFPFDTQICEMTFISLDTNGTYPGVMFSFNSVTSLSLDCYSKTGEFTLKNASVRNYTDVCHTSQFSSFSVVLLYERRPSFYVTTVIVPTFLLTFLLALTQIIPSENSIKINVACTLTLALYTLQQTVAGLLPAAENPPMLSTGMVCSLSLAGFCAASAMFTVIARMLQPTVSSACYAFLERFSWLICMPRQAIRIAPLIEVHKPEKVMHSQLLTKAYVGVHNKTEQTDRRIGELDSRLEEQSKKLDDIVSLLSGMSRSSREVIEKRVRETEHTRKWRVMDAVINMVLFIFYLAAALTCVLLFDTPISS